jgi:hypothetical protein
MPFTPPVQFVLSEDQTGNLTSIQATLPNPTTQGNTLVVCGCLGFLSGGAPGVTLSVSDNQGNVYLGARGPDISDYNGTHSQQQVFQTWYFSNLPGGTVTVTLSSSGTTTSDIMLIVLEYAGQFTFDQGIFGWRSQSGSRGIGTGNVFTSATAMDTGLTGSTSHASELLVAFGADLTGDQATYTAGTGYVNRVHFSAGGSSGFAEDGSVSSTGTQEAKATSSANIEWGLQLSTFFQPPAPPTFVHNVDCTVARPTVPLHLVDCYVFSFSSPTHSVDCWVAPVTRRQFVNLAMNLQFPIQPNAFVKLAGTVASQQLNFVNLIATIKTQSETFINLAGTLQSTTRSYVKLAGTIVNHTLTQHNVDCVVSTSSLSYVQLNGTIRGAIGPGPCGSFPDASYVKLAGWIVSAGDSIQMPNSGFARSEDWLSSQDALASYKAVSLFQLAGINLIITAFTTGVISWQTRTRSWLRRIDAAPNGILLTTSVNTHTLPNGAIITTTTQVFQIQDTIKTVITIQNSATPTRTSTTVTEETKSGQKSVRESETKNENGVLVTTTTNVFSKPPTTENIQPLRVTTLDGVQHYQFFGTVNQEWAGGEQEGTTTSTSISSIQGTTKTTHEVIDTPDGKHIETTTAVQGSNEAGTTTTDTTENYVGLQTSVHKVVKYPNGTQEITDTVTTDTPSDSHSVSTEVVTDEYGQVTTTVTDTETKTFTDPTTGLARTQITKTVTVTKGGVTTTDTTVVTTDDFENDIVNQKVQVYLIQEFTINCVIDEFSMFALWEINETHQQNFALLELFGQQLSNATLSYAFRQNLIKQFNAANSCIKPVTLQANGRTYQVVFAPSASGFRAKFIPGTEPHVYELQLILQERSNMINGTQGFF